MKAILNSHPGYAAGGTFRVVESQYRAQPMTSSEVVIISKVDISVYHCIIYYYYPNRPSGDGSHKTFSLSKRDFMDRTVPI